MTTSAGVQPVDASKVTALSGVNAPVVEERDVAALQVTGSLPDDLHGAYLRNGPNARFAPIGSYDYPFDGDAMVHGVWFGDGEVRYRNRFVHTREMAVEEQAGHALWGGMLSGVGPDPADLPSDVNPHQKVRPFINVLGHAGRYFACSEAQPWYEITAELETVGPAGFGGEPPRLCAHPKVDTATGELVLFNYGVITPPFFTWGIIGPGGTFTRPMEAVEEIDTPLMVHDFVITERHAVFFFHPLLFDLTGKFGGEPLQWQPDRPTRIAVIPRDPSAGTARWIETDPFWVWHYANAFDDGDAVVVDLPWWRSFDTAGAAGDVSLKRCRLDPAAGTVGFADLDDRVSEFPRVDDRHLGRRHHAFTVSAWSGEGTLDGDLYDTLLHVAPDTGVVQAHRFEHGGIGEAIFAPRDGGGPGDGYVLTYVFEPGRSTTDLFVLDAADIAADPVAVVHVPFRVPTGLHGSWAPVA